MIEINELLGFYPPLITNNKVFQKYILKEYVELLALEFISRSPYVTRLAFIGGTNLRLIQGIDRFSEDLDFDCKSMSQDDFLTLTDTIVDYLKLHGLRIEVRDKEKPQLTAFRRSIYFPELLFELGFIGHRDERFLMKIEAQNQGVDYENKMGLVNRLGFVFSVPVPGNDVLLSMKLTALLARAKGRDFYDVMFLWQKTEPNYNFLEKKCGIGSSSELKTAILETMSHIDMQQKKRDFEHLLFHPSRSEQILQFESFLNIKIPE